MRQSFFIRDSLSIDYELIINKKSLTKFLVEGYGGFIVW